MSRDRYAGVESRDVISRPALLAAGEACKVDAENEKRLRRFSLRLVRLVRLGSEYRAVE